MTVLLKTCPSTRDCISDVPLTEGNHSATPLGSLDVLLQTENVNDTVFHSRRKVSGYLCK